MQQKKLWITKNQLYPTVATYFFPHFLFFFFRILRHLCNSFVCELCRKSWKHQGVFHQHQTYWTRSKSSSTPFFLLSYCSVQLEHEYEKPIMFYHVSPEIGPTSHLSRIFRGVPPSCPSHRSRFLRFDVGLTAAPGVAALERGLPQLMEDEGGFSNVVPPNG